MTLETFALKSREPTKQEIDEMDFYVKTGCVHQEYLDKS